MSILDSAKAALEGVAISSASKAVNKALGGAQTSITGNGKTATSASSSTNYVYRAKGQAVRRIPQIQVTFHTDDGCYQAVGSDNTPGSTAVAEPTYQIISATTQKQLSSPAGAFTITLAGDSWTKTVAEAGKLSKKLRPNDLVVISMGYKGAPLDTVMVGLIDSVSLDRAISGDKPSVTTTIIGRDFGKVFIKGMLKFYPRLKDLKGVITDTKPKDTASVQPYFLKDFAQETFYSVFFPPNEKGEHKNLIGNIPTIADRIMRFIVQKLYAVEWSVYDTTSTAAGSASVSTPAVAPASKTSSKASKSAAKATPAPTKKTVKLANILRYVFGAFDSYFLSVNPAIATYEGSVWNLFERISIKPFSEIFLDTRDGQEAFDDKKIRVVQAPSEASGPEKSSLAEGPYPAPAVSFGADKAKVCLFIRKTPFDQDLWKTLKTHVLTDIDVTRENLTTSDNDHYNLFFVGSHIAPGNMTVDQQKMVVPPILNEAKASRYGLCPLEIDIPAMEIDRTNPTMGADIQGFALPSTKKMANWFSKNELMEHGSLEVRGKGSYKVGQVVDYTTNKKDYYIESVQQSFHMYAEWKTVVGVTRGYLKAERFKDFT